jgi:hypothetical protein
VLEAAGLKPGEPGEPGDGQADEFTPADDAPIELD